MARRVCYVVMPQYTLQQWEEMIVKPEDKAILDRARELTDQFYARHNAFVNATLAEKKRRIELVADYRHGVSFLMPKRTQAVPDHVASELIELHDKAEDAGVVCAIVDEVFKQCSSMPQIAKVWPTLYRLHEPDMTQGQKKVVGEAIRSAPNARIEITPELQRAIQFCDFHLARCSMIPAECPFGKDIIRVRVTYKDLIAHPFKIKVDANRHISVSAEYPY